MVKRAITVIIFTLILVGLGLAESIIVNKIVINLDNDVGALVTKYEANKDDVTSLLSDIDNIKQNWNKNENMLCLVFNHKDMSIITDSLSRLRTYTQNNDYDNGIVELKLLKVNTEKQPHIMGFNIHNIL